MTRHRPHATSPAMYPEDSVSRDDLVTKTGKAKNTAGGWEERGCGRRESRKERVGYLSVVSGERGARLILLQFSLT